jgi:hypothetical protein
MKRVTWQSHCTLRNRLYEIASSVATPTPRNDVSSIFSRDDVGALGRLLYILSTSRYNLDKNYISLFGTSPRLYRTM